MKVKKQRSRCLQPEECGVWLDTAQLKKRSHQTVIPCTYSSRFNPLLRRPPVDSTTFEFTQTKTPQLCTKQTSMYSFFTHKGKEVAKPKNQENITGSLCVKVTAEENDADALHIGSSSDYVDEHSAYRNTTSCYPHSGIQPSAQECKENYDECSSGTNGPVHPKDCLQNHSVRTENMQCHSADFCTSGIAKQTLVSLLDSSIHSYYPEVHDKDLHTEFQPDSPLFTQDSQGNRVIAHRAEKTRCPSGPLQDRTNVPWETASPMKRSRQYLCDDSLPCMFTQDSEGNKVIKH
ncbi:aurora kinase A and ninein-interacting protein [Rana temporaria]|uniref:aurora kinase A and ninein-interacting protein n=1 Tax=Rana temporaria TaxID=8407 RepID=UPI001AAC5C69|nr:aurora kinase A and ninein-interacting protein [Rana temporaria]